MSGVIYNDMIAYRRRPVGLFYGSDRMVSMVWDTIETHPRVERRRSAGGGLGGPVVRPTALADHEPKSTTVAPEPGRVGAEPAQHVLASFSL